MIFNKYNINALSYTGTTYTDIMKYRDSFRSADNAFDIPNPIFFRIFFYFMNSDSDSGGQNNGLLAPTWLKVDETKSQEDGWNSGYYQENSAWSYLKMNGENERADRLKDFVELLSNINSNSPWYFSSIGGLDTIIDKPVMNGEEFQFISEDRRISIKCLPDAYDTRIGTLIDLYRSVVYDHMTKREIVPANLRKFDMGIYLFSMPIKNIHNKITKDVNGNAVYDYSAAIEENGSEYVTSYKYIELHDCEILFNSSKSAYSDLANDAGKNMEYTIEINVGDAYEKRYNEFMMRCIGDMATSFNADGSKDSQITDVLNERLDAYKNMMQEAKNKGNIIDYDVNSIGRGSLAANKTLPPKTMKEQMDEAADILKKNAVGNISGLLMNTLNSNPLTSQITSTAYDLYKGADSFMGGAPVRNLHRLSILNSGVSNPILDGVTSVANTALNIAEDYIPEKQEEIDLGNLHNGDRRPRRDGVLESMAKAAARTAANTIISGII